MGSFPAPAAGWEFILDKDGTVGKAGSAGGTLMTLTELKNINNYVNGDGYANGEGYITFLFPEARDILAYSLTASWRSDLQPILSIKGSSDTTDGINGTWSVIDSPPTADVTTNSLTRSRSPKAVSWLGIKAIKFQGETYQATFTIYELHLWGTYSLTGLQLTHPTLDQPLTAADLDFGDVQRNGMVQKSFRVKNVSAQTANDVIVALDNTGSGSMYAGTNLTLGITAKSLNIGNLAPGAISSVIVAQRDVGPAEAQGIQGSTRLSATASSWT